MGRSPGSKTLWYIDEQSKTMRKRIKIIGVIIGFILIAFVIKHLFFSPREIMFEDAILYGNVKSVKEISYKAKLKNNEIVKLKRWRIGHLKDDFDCYFNEEGLIIKKIVYPAADTGTTNTRFLYRYNKKNQLINIHYENEKPKEPEYFYNIKGQLVKENRTLDYIRYDYFPDGKLRHETQVHPEIGDEFITTYKYENNFIKSRHVYYTNADWYIIDEYKRDNSGNIIKYRMSDSFDDLKKEKWDEFEYDFDKFNNWTKCIHYRNKKPIYIIEREIKYY